MKLFTKTGLRIIGIILLFAALLVGAIFLTADGRSLAEDIQQSIERKLDLPTKCGTTIIPKNKPPSVGAMPAINVPNNLPIGDNNEPD